MSTTRMTKGLGALGMLTALGFVLASSSCSTDDLTGECRADVVTSVNALKAASAKLETLAASMEADLTVACDELAKAGGETPSTGTLAEKCQVATAVIEANLTGDVQVVISGGQCHVDAQAQLDCEATCNASGECQPGSIDVRCEPGQLSVECSGTCNVNAKCEGTLEVAANCTGKCGASCSGSCEGTLEGSCTGNCTGTCTTEINASCSGKCTGKCGSADVTDAPCGGICNGQCSTTGTAACTGTCSGTCSGTASGSCNGTCEGTCTGTCEITADAGVSCGADARCTGGCTGTATAPQCQGELKPPSCTVNADCNAGCQGEAQFDVTCEPVAIDVVGTVDADFKAAFIAQIPKVLTIAAKAQAAGVAAVNVGETFVKVAAAAVPACVVEVGADIVATAQASVTASVSVSASVSASASVSGSVTGGGG